MTYMRKSGQFLLFVGNLVGLSPLWLALALDPFMEGIIIGYPWAIFYTAPVGGAVGLFGFLLMLLSNFLARKESNNEPVKENIKVRTVLIWSFLLSILLLIADPLNFFNSGFLLNFFD